MRLRSHSANSQALNQVGLDLVERNTDLLHRVTLTNGDGVILNGIKVVGDAEGRTNFVLATVATANSTGIVVLDVPQVTQLLSQFLCRAGQFVLARQRQDSNLDGSQTRVELEDDALIDTTLCVGGFVLVVGDRKSVV